MEYAVGVSGTVLRLGHLGLFVFAALLAWGCFVVANSMILFLAIAMDDGEILAPLDCRAKSFAFVVLGLQAMIGRAVEQHFETVGRWHLTFLVAVALGTVLLPNSPLWLLRTIGPGEPWLLFAALSSLALSFPIGAVLFPIPKPIPTDLRLRA